MLNKVFLHGRLTKAPDQRQTANGVTVCRFTVAVDRNFTAKGEEKKTDFIDCTAWRQTAEFIGKYFDKGSAIIVEGSIANNNFEDKNGTKHYSYAVIVEHAYFAESKSAGSKSADASTEKYAEEIAGDDEFPF